MGSERKNKPGYETFIANKPEPKFAAGLLLLANTLSPPILPTGGYFTDILWST